MFAILAIAIASGLLGSLISRSIAPGIAVGLIASVCTWLFLPVLSFGFVDLYVLAGAVLLCSAAGAAIWNSNDVLDSPDSSPVGIFFGSIVLGLILFIGLPAVMAMTTHVFSGKSYHHVLSTPGTGHFETDVAQIDQSQVRVVDEEIAKNRAEELLGADAGLGSWAQVGEIAIQSVDGGLYWVAPLVPRGFWKWNGHDGTPGYVKVSATNIQDAEINLSHPIRYGVNGFYFSTYLPRLLWSDGYASDGLTDYTLELDDEGKPWWVVTVYENTVGFSGEVARGVIVVDAASGEHTYYDIDEAPSWLERIQPEWMVRRQIGWWGEYVHGWWNWSQQDVLKPTNGMSLVYGADGRSLWYTGIQSASQDAGAMGFMLVDSRTGEATLYRKNGVTEDGAKESIEGKVANFDGYSASDPILYNVDNEPVFVSTIKDRNGNYKGIGVVSMYNRAVVVTGDTIHDALRQFASALRSQGLSSAIDTGGLAETFSGKVVRIGSELIDGETHWYLMLDSKPEAVFLLPAGMIQPTVPLTRAGDEVEIRAVDTGASVLTGERLTNASLPAFQKSKGEAAAEARSKSIRDANEARRDDRNLKAKYENLSEEEKRELLKQLSR